MSYRIIREPFILQETVGMIYKYVNKITFRSTLRAWRGIVDAKKDESRLPRMERLQKIMEEACQGLDTQEPEIQRFFGRVEYGAEDLCLAQLLTLSFCTLRKPKFRDNVEEILDEWKRLWEHGYWIGKKSAISLTFCNDPGCPGGLLRQIRALNYPPEFKLELCDALENFEENVLRLAELIEPYAERLEKIYQRESDLFEERWSYWEDALANKPLPELLSGFGVRNAVGVEGAAEETCVAVTLMSTNILSCAIADDPNIPPEYNRLYIGCNVTLKSFVICQGSDIDSVGIGLKCLSDRRRLEILQHLGKERAYGQELAEITGMDPGNLSRNLAMLHNCGFVQQERGTLRTYYRADREMIHNFLIRVEQAIFP